MAAPLSELHYRLAWTLPELAQLLGLSAGELRSCLEDADSTPIKVDDIPPDGEAWIRVAAGVRLPCRRNVNGHLRFFADEVRPLLASAGRQLHPAGADR